MLLLDNIADNGHAQPGTFSDGLGGEEIFEEPLLHLVTHALTIVGNGDGQHAISQRSLDVDSGGVVIALVLRTLVHSIAGIVHQIENGTAEVLGDDHQLGNIHLIVLMDADVETLVVSAHGVVGQPNILLDDVVDVRRQKLVFLASRHQQDAPDNADGTLAMFDDLGQILLQVGNDVFRRGAGCQTSC